MGTFHGSFLALHTVIEAVLKALSRPQQLITQITAARRDAERNRNSLGRSSRWPLGLLDDARQRLNDERIEKARRSEAEAERLGKELKYTQQTVAQELAGWREVHEKVARRAIREMARGVVIAEKNRMDGLLRALRKVREGSTTGTRARKGPEGGLEAAAAAVAATVASSSDLQNGVTLGLDERPRANKVGQVVSFDDDAAAIVGDSAAAAGGSEISDAST